MLLNYLYMLVNAIFVMTGNVAHDHWLVRYHCDLKPDCILPIYSRQCMTQNGLMLSTQLRISEVLIAALHVTSYTIPEKCCIPLGF